MEVHAPEHGIHSWRDFLVHMGTVCIGLVIALALEQAVIAIHEAHQRAELRAALNTDSREAISDAERSEKSAQEWMRWTAARMVQVRTALATNTPLVASPLPHTGDFDIVNDPSFKAAKSSGQLALLPQREVIAYSEFDYGAEAAAKTFDWSIAPYERVVGFESEFPSVSGAADFSKATPEELRHYLDLLVDSTWSMRVWYNVNHEVQGLNMALLRGERDLGRLQKAERWDDTPGAKRKYPRHRSRDSSEPS